MCIPITVQSSHKCVYMYEITSVCSPRIYYVMYYNNSTQYTSILHYQVINNAMDLPQLEMKEKQVTLSAKCFLVFMF